MIAASPIHRCILARLLVDLTALGDSLKVPRTCLKLFILFLTALSSSRVGSEALRRLV